MSTQDLFAAAAARDADPTAPEWSRVREALLAEPERLTGDAELLDRLGLRPAASNVVDLGRAALARLEAAAARESDARRQIEQVARANFAAQAQTNAAVVDLLDSRNHADLARRLDAAAKSRFGLVAGVIALEKPGAVPFGWRPLDPGGVERLVGARGLARLGPLEDDVALFGPEAEAVKSAAVVRMAPWGTRSAVAAFGSGEPDGFTPEMGAELVAFLARVVERTAERWPVL